MEPTIVKMSVALASFALVGLGIFAIKLKLAPARQSLPLYTPETRATANTQDAPVTSSAISPDAKDLAFSDRTGLFIRQLAGRRIVFHYRNFLGPYTSKVGFLTALTCWSRLGTAGHTTRKASGRYPWQANFQESWLRTANSHRFRRTGR